MQSCPKLTARLHAAVIEVDDVTLNDVDECENSICDKNATCDNSVGLYMYSCKDCFKTCGTTCVDVDE